MTELQLLMRRERYKTNHILHLLLSVLSAGLWVPLWILVALNNGIERQKVDRRLGVKNGNL